MNCQFPDCHYLPFKRTRDVDPAGQKPNERTVARNAEVYNTVVDQIVRNDADDREIMNEETLLCCWHPLIVKDENVPFHRCPREQGDLKWVEEIVDKYPQSVELCRCRPRCFETIVVDKPRNDHYFVDQAENQKNDDHVVVQSVTKNSIREQKVESERCAGQGNHIGDEKRPESNLVRNMDHGWYCRIVRYSDK